ncbi:single-stranded DNA-binding protein [Sphaerospermopsis torques-reginae ITEP-024]|uniref:Single-stranded DNA-binding protein n=2 Tax=Sphaerospermopsis TaxID=752201 RepID=A0ABX8X6R0_9CYAN|nr:single-stranded DNA-binding protein [Sphaerospermopsis torques-reginae ITEP-024]
MIGSGGNNQDYDPLKYLEILYTHKNHNENPHPLKIYDPVKDQHPNFPEKSPTIINFCKTLNILYSRRENLKLNEFVIFHFQGRGLLQGTKLGSNEKTKILAYCGKCGYPHIIRNEEPGKNNICKSDTCKYLICPKCKCCQKDCSEYKKRTEDNQKSVDILGLNVVNLVGRAGQEPDVKHFEDGKIRCNLSLAVNRRNKNDNEPDWFTLRIWGKTAEIAANDVHKGSQIAIQGALIFDTWIDDKTEAHRSKPVIQVEQLYLLDKKRNQQYNLNDW